MAGQLGVEVRHLAQQFNQSQTEYQVIPIYKGDYTESLTSFAAAFRAKRPPNMIQVFEVGSSVMRFPTGVVKPIDVLMHEQGIHMSKDAFFPAVLNRYSDNGQLMALPFNVSIPVMFYNASLLAKFGVSRASFPTTWDELELLAKRLHDAGLDCVYTSAYPAWILIESYLALNGLSSNHDSAALYHNKHLQTHLERMRRWQKKHYFEYGGHIDDSTVLFTSERCPLFSQSSGGYASLTELVPFHVAMAPMPLDTQVGPIRHNNVIGGAAIWVVAGQSPVLERGVARFLAFITQPEIQRKWYERTGYLPLENNTHLSTEANQLSVLDIAALDLTNEADGPQVSQAEPQNQIRTINDQMLEAIFSGMMSTEDAMNKTKVRVHHAIQRFFKNTHTSL